MDDQNADQNMIGRIWWFLKKGTLEMNPYIFVSHFYTRKNKNSKVVLKTATEGIYDS